MKRGQTDKQTDRLTSQLYESIDPEDRCFENTELNCSCVLKLVLFADVWSAMIAGAGSQLQLWPFVLFNVITVMTVILVSSLH